MPDAEHREANFDLFDFELSAGGMDVISRLRGDQRIPNLEFAPDWND